MTRSDPIKVGVAGALGRMGAVVAAAVAARPELCLVAAFDRPEHTGAAFGSLTLTNPPTTLAACDVVIDFSNAAASAELAVRAAEAGSACLVTGSTGFSPEQEAAIAAAVKRIAIVKSGNFSIGVNVLAGIVEETARRLGPEAWDIEILEAHHRRKIDAPSGTALMLAAAAASGRGRSLADVRAPEREGITGARRDGDIGISVVRGGGIVGEHSITFVAEEEILTLSHSARDRSLFARGATAAAIWVAGRAPGLYDMMDVLGFRD